MWARSWEGLEVWGVAGRDRGAMGGRGCCSIESEEELLRYCVVLLIYDVWQM